MYVQQKKKMGSVNPQSRSLSQIRGKAAEEEDAGRPDIYKVSDLLLSYSCRYSDTYILDQEEKQDQGGIKDIDGMKKKEDDEEVTNNCGNKILHREEGDEDQQVAANKHEDDVSHTSKKIKLIQSG